MRALLASSIGVTCAAALTVPLALSAAPATARPESSPALEAGAAGASGSTRSLALAPLTRDRAAGSVPTMGLTRREVPDFSMVGVVWDGSASAPPGQVQVRTRDATTGVWSGWRDLGTDTQEHAPDPGTEEAASGAVRGGTAPLWVGDSNGVEARVRAGSEGSGAGSGSGSGEADGTRAVRALPQGLHLELVDPGGESASVPAGRAVRDSTEGSTRDSAEGSTRDSADGSTEDSAEDSMQDSASDSAQDEPDVLPALSREETAEDFARVSGAGSDKSAPGARPYIGPRPRIVTRRGWGADEGMREGGYLYTKKVKAIFVHHTVSGNKYTCSQAPSLIRGIYRYHVKSIGWRDIGYNFLVDKCGNIYEGRAGGVTRAVKGAHTLGFNSNSAGVAVIGTFTRSRPTSAAVSAVARLAAWKLGLYGVNPKGKTTLRSAGGGLYRKGKNVRLNAISGHRDGFLTDCPGGRLYKKLGSARTASARYQGR
jgi:uncharacterized protein with LGFP repeats